VPDPREIPLLDTRPPRPVRQRRVRFTHRVSASTIDRDDVVAATLTMLFRPRRPF
jgi:hypothetical protein